MPGTPRLTRPRRKRGDTPASYQSECIDCSWDDTDANSTNSAYQHAIDKEHTTECMVVRAYTYYGRDA